MPNLQIINPIDYPGWDELVLSIENYSFFHSSHWAKVLIDSYKYKPLYFTEFVNGGISTLIPILEIKSLITGKRGISLPFTDYCEPVIDQKIDFIDAIDHLISYGKKSSWKYIELRGGKVPPGIAPSSSYYIHTLELAQDADETFNTFRNSTKRNIKKAIKEGIRIRISKSIDSVREFYRLNCITRKKHGLPPQPYHFFRKIFDHILSKNAGIIVLASHQENAIAASVYFHFGKKAMYKYGASDSRYQHLRANNLVMWEAIKWYCQNGYKRFCFGRTEPDNKGLLQFKSGWGTQQNVLEYYKYHINKQAFISKDKRKTRLYNTFFNKIPLPVLKLIGTVMYPHVG
jgi:hypothetical protein